MILVFHYIDEINRKVSTINSDWVKLELDSDGNLKELPCKK